MKKYEKAEIRKIMFSLEEIITASAADAPDITGRSVEFKNAWVENNGGSQSNDILDA